MGNRQWAMVRKEADGWCLGLNLGGPMESKIPSGVVDVLPIRSRSRRVGVPKGAANWGEEFI